MQSFQYNACPEKKLIGVVVIQFSVRSVLGVLILCWFYVSFHAGGGVGGFFLGGGGERLVKLAPILIEIADLKPQKSRNIK